MTAQLAPLPVFQAFAPNGQFLVGGQLFTYAAGTTTPQATYVDSTQTTQNTNPVILNAMGQANVWLNPALTYKFVLQDAAGNPMYTVDNVAGALSAASIIIGPPASGPALVVNGVNPATSLAMSVTNGPSAFTNNGLPLLFLNNSGAGGSTIQNDSALNWSIAYTAGTGLSLGTPIIKWTSTGNVSIPAPSTGVALLVSGAPGAFGMNVSPGPLAVTNNGLPLILLNSGGAGFATIQNDSALNWSLGYTAGTGLTLGTPIIKWNSAAQVIVNGTLGINNNTGPAQLAGWGTATGAAVIANFPGASATLVQATNAIAQIITTLKAFGLYAA